MSMFPADSPCRHSVKPVTCESCDWFQLVSKTFNSGYCNFPVPLWLKVAASGQQNTVYATQANCPVHCSSAELNITGEINA